MNWIVKQVAALIVGVMFVACVLGVISVALSHPVGFIVVFFLTAAYACGRMLIDALID